MKTTINRLNSFCIILCSLSMSTISSAEAQKLSIQDCRLQWLRVIITLQRKSW